MKFRDFAYLVRADLYRYTGSATWSRFVKLVLFQPGFKYSFLFRLCSYLSGKRLALPLYLIARLVHRHYSLFYGITIPFRTHVGAGLYIGHYGCLIVNHEAVIGKNCNLSHGVTIGQANRGPRKGCPIIGDDVYIGPGAKVIGAVRVGNRVAIGANCVVVDDIPDNAVVVGIPGKVISFNGVEGYVENRWEG